MARVRQLDAQHATERAHKSTASRRVGAQVTDNRLFATSLDEFRSETHERREAALKVTDMAVGLHDCELGDKDACTHPDHERDADWALVALDVLGLDVLADDEPNLDLDLAAEPTPGRGKGDARLARSAFARPDWRWQDSAACRGEDLILFFGPDGERAPERLIREMKAKRICAGCPVREQCLSYAVSRPEKYGLYGGMDEDERVSERRRRMRKANAA